MSELNRLMIEDGVRIVKELEAAALMVFIDALDNWTFWKEIEDKKRLVLATRSSGADRGLGEYMNEIRAVVKLPPVNLTRMSQIKLSVIISITEGVINASDRVVCLSGEAGRGLLDTLMVLELDRENEVFAAGGISRDLLKHLKPEVLETVLKMALELSSEGREGKAIGATFVIGDHEKVLKLSRPLILNPFKGYPEEMRNILDASVHETIKEYSLLDGAFIVREDGVVMSSGVHLDAALEEEGLMPGLGCRHMAAAGITDVTDAVAITISGSTGIVRIFRKGKILLELEKPPGVSVHEARMPVA